MAYLIDYIFVLFALISCIIAIYLIGNLLNSNFKKYTSQFFIFIIGIFSSIIIISLFLSKGKTFNLSVLTSVPIIFYLTKQKLSLTGLWHNFKENIHPEFFFLVIPALLYFWVQSFNYYNPLTDEYFFLEGDQLYYATIGNYLYNFGIENRFLDILNLSNSYLSTHHYGDSWFVAFFYLFYHSIRQLF